MAEDSTPATTSVNLAPKSELRRKRIKAFIFKHKKIEIGYSHSDFLKENYKTVFIALYNKGFNNIKFLPIKDIYTDSCFCPGEFEQVVINGSSCFEKQE
jgi:hypothetical protein